MTIYFYRLRDPYGELSNHSPHGFVLDGLYCILKRPLPH